VELAGIAVAFAIFVIVWNTRKNITDTFFLLTGISFLFIGSIDFIHTLAYKGMGIFPGDNADLPTQLWIAARYFQSITFLIAALLAGRSITRDRKYDAGIFLSGCAVATALLLTGIFISGQFPHAFVEGSGLTPFKIGSEYIISLVMLVTIGVLVLKRDTFDRTVWGYLIAAQIFLIAGELAFTSYVNVFSFMNMLGHLFRLVSVYLFYRAIVVATLTRPFDTLFRELGESERKYRSLSDLSPDAIIVARDGMIRYVNDAGIRMAGLAAHEIIGRDLQDFIHPDDRKASVDQIIAVQNDEVSAPLRELKVIIGGKTIEVEATAGPVRWEGKRAAQIVIHDITERKITENNLKLKNDDLSALNQELRATQEELQRHIDDLITTEHKLRETTGNLETLYTSMNEGLALHEMIYTDGNPADYCITDVNPAFENITGIRKTDAVGRKASELYGTGTPPFIEVYARVSDGNGPEQFETYFPPMDKYFRISVFSPAKGTFATVFSDVTGRKLAVLALERSNQQLSEVLDSIQDDFYVLDRNWNFVFASRQFTEKIGKEPADFIGRNLWEMFPSHRGTELEQNFRAAMGERESRRFELHGRYTDAWYSMTVFPSRDGITVLGTDITERKESEEIQKLTGEVYRISADLSDLPAMLNAYARLLQHFSGCDSIGIRLIDNEGNIPYHASIGFSEDFFQRESPLSIRSHQCMCINVITGTTDPALPFYTEAGSFFINATTKFLATVPEEEKGRTRNVCNQVGYESVALIPIRRGETITGLLHLADHHEGKVPEWMVRILEVVAFAMGSQIMRLNAETSLRETSQYLESLINYANAPIIVWDREFRITRFNHAFEDLTGLTASEVIGQSLSILFPEKFRDPSMEVIRRTMQGERLNIVEIPILRKDGDIRIVLWNSATLFSRDGMTILSTIAQGQDITERKIAEAANIRAREEWEQTFNTVPDLIAILDTNHRIIRVNKAMAERLGTNPENCIGKLCHEAVHGTAIPPEFCPHTKTCTDGKQHIAEVHESGLGGTFMVSTTPLLDPAGILIGTVHVAHDITERIKAENELRQRHEDLNRAYEKIAATQEELQQNLEELSSRESQLQEALAEKEILLSEIHHRVKNNLTAFISLLSLDGTYEDTESGRALKKDLQNRARSMALIHETLYRTRKFSNVEMETYLTTLVSQIAGSYASHGSVRTLVEAREASLDLGRATTAGLIINELVTNSFKYAFPPGFDCMAVRGEPCTIRVTLAPVEGTHILTVADNGVGLPPGLDPLVTRSLGLKLVNFLSRHQLQADIEVRSDKGTAFIFTLKKREE